MSADNLRSSADPAQLQRTLDELRAQRKTLLDALCTALPFVEDAEDDPCFKPGHVKKTVRDIRQAIESVELAMKAPDKSQAAVDANRTDQLPPGSNGKEHA